MKKLLLALALLFLFLPSALAWEMEFDGNYVTFPELDGEKISCKVSSKGSFSAVLPLYLTLYGYAEDQLAPGMITTIYGTVAGEKTLSNEKRMEILVEYGTYLVSK